MSSEFREATTQEYLEWFRQACREVEAELMLRCTDKEGFAQLLDEETEMRSRLLALVRERLDELRAELFASRTEASKSEFRDLLAQMKLLREDLGLLNSLQKQREESTCKTKSGRGISLLTLRLMRRTH